MRAIGVRGKEREERRGYKGVESSGVNRWRREGGIKG